MLLKALFPDLYRMIQLALRSLGHRAKLAGLELAEARDQLVMFLLLILASAVLALLGIGVLSLLVAALCWDTAYRIPVLIGLGAAYLIGAGVCIAIIRYRLRRWDPFALTKHQLRQDSDCIDNLFDTP